MSGIIHFGMPGVLLSDWVGGGGGEGQDGDTGELLPQNAELPVVRTEVVSPCAHNYILCISIGRQRACIFLSNVLQNGQQDGRGKRREGGSHALQQWHSSMAMRFKRPAYTHSQ